TPQPLPQPPPQPLPLAISRPVAPVAEASATAQPVRSGASAPQVAATAAPPLEVAPQTADSGSSRSGSETPERDPTRKAEPAPATELKPLLRDAPAEMTQQIAGPAPIATVASPVARLAPAPSSSTAAPP